VGAWEILKDASVLLLVGFLFAGMLAVLVHAALLSRLVETSKVKSVLWASTLGAPLPLCSCGALPTALGLRKQGATPGATVAFMVATPETGIDSISLTYALTDPTMTILRPITGIVMAIAAGLATNFFGASRPGTTSAHAALQRCRWLTKGLITHPPTFITVTMTMGTATSMSMVLGGRPAGRQTEVRRLGDRHYAPRHKVTGP
jgi:uncharacterized membrane protein YraQ (UPF0718 family)